MASKLSFHFLNSGCVSCKNWATECFIKYLTQISGKKSLTCWKAWIKTLKNGSSSGFYLENLFYWSWKRLCVCVSHFTLTGYPRSDITFGNKHHSQKDTWFRTKNWPCASIVQILMLKPSEFYRIHSLQRRNIFVCYFLFFEYINKFFIHFVLYFWLLSHIVQKPT